MVAKQCCWVLMGLALLLAPGCKGCSSTDAEDKEAEKQAEEKKKKQPIELSPLMSLYGQEISEDPAGKPTPKILVKPGHWMPTVQRMKANYDDYVLTHSGILVDDSKQPTKIPQTQFSLESTRPVALAKGKPKRIISEVFVPEGSQATRLHTEFRNKNSGFAELEINPKLVRMPSYQYFLIVLAKEPNRYAFLKVIDTVRNEWEEEYDAISQPHYRVSLADAGDDLPLDSNLLNWTTVAAIVWDEVDPTRLSADQQAALVDWLHWGGRLVINGPDSLDSLRGSFLDEYLPVDAKGPRNFDAVALSRWSEYWGQRKSGQQIPPLEPIRPMSGLELLPRENSQEMVGGDRLFYQANVGSGSIIVSAVQLTQRELVNWPGYDGFINAALLGRPRRFFSRGPYEGIRIDWQDHADHRLDANLTTGLRFFARDTAAKANALSQVQQQDANPFGFNQGTSYLKVDRQGGVGSWGDFNPTADAARSLLVKAAGVEMPAAGFVLMCVGIYLVVLVPLNWMVFHTLGRVEWAWIAAPVIAIAGTYGVVRMAQLDIGFVRAQTEVALLELHGGHDRGLLSRYTALYSSLSTTYSTELDGEQSVTVPFAASEEEMDLSLRNQQFQVEFSRGSKPMLEGLAISSNSTRYLRTEQVYPLEGAIRLGKSSRGELQVENQSGLDIDDVVVVRRYFISSEEKPTYQASWVGKLRHGASETLGLLRYDLATNRLPFPEERNSRPGVRSERLDADRLIQLAFRYSGDEDLRNNRREEYRLVGRIDSVLPGVEISPSASQIQGTTVVVAHLKFGPPARPRPDVNSRGDVKLTEITFGDE